MRHPLDKRGFTLIELLIVVAIIAILAAIAVPNFLEAQVRSKVSRTLSDMRSMRTGLESYRVDHNKYPETDQGISAYTNNGLIAIDRITTPVAYMTSIPGSPWNEEFGDPGDPKLADVRGHYLYVRRIISPGFTEFPAGTETDQNYYLDRITYLQATGSLPVLRGIGTGGEWLMKSVGPNNIDDRDATVFGASARVYDPTNGTISDGDIVVFSDKAGTGKNI